MDFRDYLLKDLDFIKKSLTIENINQRDAGGRTILHGLCYYSFNDLEIFKYVFEFVKIHSPNLFFSQDYLKNTFFYDLIFSYKSIQIFKYIFEFIRDNFPIIFIRTYEYYGFISRNYIIHYGNFETFEYTFSFLKNNFPDLLLETNSNFKCRCDEEELSSEKYLFRFIINNCPEILNDRIVKNHSFEDYLVLPLIFQIQN